MSKKFLHLALMATAVGVMGYVCPAGAKRISENAAAGIARQFTGQNASKYKKAPTVGKKAAYAPSVNGEPVFYLFNNRNSAGFTIVSGDDELPAILGYTLDGEYDPANVAPNFKYWLEETQREISWYYTRGGKARVIEKDERNVIEPMLTTRWNQSTPYNNNCPKVGGRVSVTGCVATAMAQVLNYNKWPEVGEGRVPVPESSNPSAGFTFERHPIDYSQMLDIYENGNYTEEQANAVAELMLACGRASLMNYSPSASGALDINMQAGLIQYLKYNPGTGIHRRDYMSLDKWEEMVYGELAQNRPVLMCGSSNQGGHCFVADGYAGNGYFHFNWGWGGYQDGYFLLYSLNPAAGGIGSYEGGYNSNQSIITNLTPAGVADTEKDEYLLIQTYLTYQHNEEGYSSLLVNDGILYNPTGLAQDVQVAVAFEDVNNPENITYVMGWDTPEDEMAGTLNPSYGFRSVDYIDPQLPDGEYTVYIVSRNNLSKPFKKVACLDGFPSYVPLTVSQSELKYGEVSDYGKVTAIVKGGAALDNNYDTSSPSAELTLANISDVDWYGTLQITAIPEGSTSGTFRMNQTVVIPAGRTRDISFGTSSILKEGVYNLRITDTFAVADLISEPLKLTVKKGSGRVLDKTFNVTDITPRVIEFGNGNDLIITMRNNGSNSITSPVVFNLMKEKDGSFEKVTSFTTGDITLARNQTGNFLLSSTPLKDVEPGEYVWHLDTPSGEIVSRDIPVTIVKYAEDEAAQLAYLITDEQGKQARLTAPRNGHYAGIIEVPSSVNGYTLPTTLDGVPFATAERVTELTIPATVTAISDGAFYRADNLSKITFKSTVPPVLGKMVMPVNTNSFDISVPDNSANLYARAEGWDEISFPNWEFDIRDGLKVSGPQTAIDAETNEVYAPYYVNRTEMPELVITGNDHIEVICNLSDGTISYTQLTDGKYTLPALGDNKRGKLMVGKDLSGIEDVFDVNETADVYDLNGILVLKDADFDALKQLPAGLYIWGGRKFLRK